MAASASLQPTGHTQITHPVQHAIIVAGRAWEIADVQDGPLTAGRFEILLAAEAGQPADAVAAPARLISCPLGALTVGRGHHHGTARRCGIRTANQPGLHGPARNDAIIAPVAWVHRTHMTGWSNVARAVISKVLPTF